ncbi:radical SAM/SPASM domain-containing protein [Thermofilum pendens]|nr:radical SAM protein [Thermofilum pendens]
MSRVLPWYVPPTLFVRQVLSAATVRSATGWSPGSRWVKSLSSLLRSANGAKAMGCFGYAPHPVYEVTAACNLRCAHCHASAGRPYPGELDTEGAKRVIESLTTVKDFRTLVFTGGEPLVRKDIWELTRHAVDLGFGVVFATNGVLVSESVAAEMRRLGVLGAAVSLDSSRPLVHDKLRGVPGAWRGAVRGIKNLLKEGLYVQVNITANRLNVDEIEDVVRLADSLGSHVIFLYTFVSVGRGSSNDWLSLTPEEFVKLSRRILKVQGEVQSLIIPVAMPWYFPLLLQEARLKPEVASRWVSGCIAARGMFYVKPNGDAWPCAFIPVSGGNVARQPAIEVWEGDLFKAIRNRENLEEPCRSCRFREVCGGCRSRAYLATGRLTAPDPLCPLVRRRLSTSTAPSGPLQPAAKSGEPN